MLIKCFLLIVALFAKLSLQEFRAVSPPSLLELFQNAPIHYSKSEIGRNLYGQKLLGKIYYPFKENKLKYNTTQPIELCDSLDIQRQPEPVQTKIDSKEEYSSTEGNFFILIDRGTCAFSIKMRNAQTLGANLLIIADNQEIEDVDNVLLIQKFPEHDLKIPAIMISKRNGNILKNYLLNSNNGDNQFSIAFEHPPRTERVDVKYIFRLFNSEDYIFLKQFAGHYAEAGEAAAQLYKFQPLHYIWRDSSCARPNEKKQKFCQDECILNGQYCLKNEDKKGSLKGTDIIWEIVRQLCVEEQSPKLYFEYMRLFESEVLQKGTGHYKKEIDELPKKVKGLDLSALDKCFDDSKIAAENQNTKLHDMRTEEYFLNATTAPMLLANKEAFIGDVTVQESTLAFICEAFTTSPKVCQKWDKRNGLSYNEIDNQKASNILVRGYIHPALAVLIAVLIVLAIILLYFLMQRNRLRRQIREDISREVAQSVQNYYGMNIESSQL